MSEDGQERFLTREEFDGMWDTAREAAGLNKPDKPRRPEKVYYLHPVLVLYTGFFFGPFATAVMAMGVLKGRVPLRSAGLLVGASGLTWCLAQGVTQIYAESWSTFALQFVRSGANFVNGVACYAVVYKHARGVYGVESTTWRRSMVAIFVMAGAFWVLTSSILFALGR